MVVKAVIPAAGYGTRNLPVSKAVPKEMFPICGKPALHYIVDEAVAAGIREILIVVSRGKNAILDYFDRAPELEQHLQAQGKSDVAEQLAMPDVHIQYVRQPEALGLGMALKLAQPFVGQDPFALLLPDDLLTDNAVTLKRMIRAFKVYRRPVIGIKTVEDETLLRNYGVIRGTPITTGMTRIEEIVEKPVDKPPSNMAVIGRYVLPAEIFAFIHKDKRGAGGEIQLTDALQEWLETAELYGMNIKSPSYDISKMEDYLALQNYYLNREGGIR
ncbi:hypothetical protein B1A99_01960 [Cohnella sp. CIP 111063]|jgi:UDP-glucose pyrophosphorylase|uniref:UTP--glucose-1-phosphate uridylyltransferase n=1 Tax=unclassified Cohnella TaxID=2636738 RepID=UPI000B8C4C41|nr:MULTISPECIES: UTP--glucose-1-phosphate uridylyltransferase [unclassified Cohnella]OXS62645.1 hypothetical protein B1A99_01960 [Cohnella sp. CIP 111063]PRX74906.1 UDP-glucose pyrophosphorylase [Cohnella sp. SGD-V74]